MFGYFDRRRVLNYIAALIENQIGAYDWVIKLTLKELEELFIVINDRVNERKLNESVK